MEIRGVYQSFTSFHWCESRFLVLSRTGRSFMRMRFDEKEYLGCMRSPVMKQDGA
jgi:hypothetical protein